MRLGTGGLAAEKGWTSLGGKIPVNPSGGLKAKGHPIGATGIAQIFEICEQLGWTESSEIIAEFIVSAVGFYYFFVHSFTTARPFIQFAIFKDRNFVGGCVFMAVMGLVLFSTMALSSGNSKP